MELLCYPNTNTAAVNSSKCPYKAPSQSFKKQRPEQLERDFTPPALRLWANVTFVQRLAQWSMQPIGATVISITNPHRIQIKCTSFIQKHALPSCAAEVLLHRELWNEKQFISKVHALSPETCGKCFPEAAARSWLLSFDILPV